MSRNCRALLSNEPGGPRQLTLGELAIPGPQEGQLGVAVLACAINYPDVLIIEDKYQFRPTRPFAPGMEICGVVEDVGEGVEHWSRGDRLIAVVPHGGLAEYAVIAADQAFRFTGDRNAAEGAALLLSYATSLHALADRAALGSGETLLVLGAAGGVGLAAVEIGKAMGAVVVAVTSSDAKAAAARQAGADRTIVYGAAPANRDDAERLAAAFKQAAGVLGADVIFDPVGGAYAEAALRAIAWKGRYLAVGFSAGIPRIPLNLALLKSCDVRGVSWGGFAEREPDRNRAHVEQLFRWWCEKRVRPRVGRTWPLERGGEAIAWLADRQAIGKAVVLLDETAACASTGTK